MYRVDSENTSNSSMSRVKWAREQFSVPIHERERGEQWNEQCESAAGGVRRWWKSGVAERRVAVADGLVTRVRAPRVAPVALADEVVPRARTRQLVRLCGTHDTWMRFKERKIA